MDKQAIDTIQGIVAASLELPQTNHPAVLCPDGSALVGMERFQAHPYRMRAEFNTERISDFCRYVDAEMSGDTAVFIAPDGSGATGVIDFGDSQSPEWGEHRAVLSMKHTPSFAALNDIEGKPLNQRAIIDYLEDWQFCIRPYRDGEEISVSQAVQCLRRVDIDTARKQTFEEDDFKGSQSALEQIEAKSGAGSIPRTFILPIAMYEETTPRDIEVRLSLRTSGDDATHAREVSVAEHKSFMFRIVGRDALDKDVAQEIEETVSTRLQVERVFIGNI